MKDIKVKTEFKELRNNFAELKKASREERADDIAMMLFVLYKDIIKSHVIRGGVSNIPLVKLSRDMVREGDYTENPVRESKFDLKPKSLRKFWEHLESKGLGVRIMHVSTWGGWHLLADSGIECQ